MTGSGSLVIPHPDPDEQSSNLYSDMCIRDPRTALSSPPPPLLLSSRRLGPSHYNLNPEPSSLHAKLCLSLLDAAGIASSVRTIPKLLESAP